MDLSDLIPGTKYETITECPDCKRQLMIVSTSTYKWDKYNPCSACWSDKRPLIIASGTKTVEVNKKKCTTDGCDNETNPCDASDAMCMCCIQVCTRARQNMPAYGKDPQMKECHVRSELRKAVQERNL